MKPIKVTPNVPEAVKKAAKAQEESNAPEKTTAEDEAENVEATKGDPKYDEEGNLIPADPDSVSQPEAPEKSTPEDEAENVAATEGDPKYDESGELIVGATGMDNELYQAKTEELATLRERVKTLSAEVKALKSKLGRHRPSSEEKMKLPDDIGELDANWQEAHKVLGSGMQVAVLKTREMSRTKVAKRYNVKPMKIGWEIGEAVKTLKKPENADLVKRLGLETFLANRK